MEGGQVAAFAPNVKLVGIWVAAILTLMIYSHLVRDNPLSRLAEHLFVGTAAGYALVLAYYNVLWPKLIHPLASDASNNSLLIIPAVLAVLLLLRPIAPLRSLASIPLALIVGVGAALAVAGAVAGSLLPQVSGTMLSLDPSQPAATVIDNALIIIGVISTVLYFYFTAARKSRGSAGLRVAAGLGKWTMMLTFGAVFAATITARLAVLVGRMQFLLSDWLGLIR
jgi:hypothetical protein